CEDAGVFATDRAAGTYRSESGNAGSPGGGASVAGGGAGWGHFTHGPAECWFDDYRPIAGLGIREDRVRVGGCVGRARPPHICLSTGSGLGRLPVLLLERSLPRPLRDLPVPGSADELPGRRDR